MQFLNDGGRTMIKLEHTEILGWEHAIRGMRNPMNSWEKSDSEKMVPILGYKLPKVLEGQWSIGENDWKLMTSLVKAGSDHSKFMRMINVYVDITAPLYWWKEFDTYKVGTVANSCSTMHTIHEKEFTLDDFSCEYLEMLNFDKLEGFYTCIWCLKDIIDILNSARDMYLKTKDKKYWWQMIQLLPSSYNQKRTIQLNYAVLRNVYHARKNHKLDEWREFCDWIESLPYSELITMETEHE